MAMCNIPSTNTDPQYRYKMPRLVAKVEGRGNGIKTCIVNMGEVARAIKRPPQYVTKFFGNDLGAQSTYTNKEGEGERSIVRGAHQVEDLRTSLDKFIEKYVCCENCHLPEIDMLIKKGIIQGRCNACGWAGELDNVDKLAAFILKNPPDESGMSLGTVDQGGKRDKKNKKGKEDKAEEDDEDDDDASGSGGKEKKDKKDKKDKKEKKEKKERTNRKEGEDKEEKRDQKVTRFEMHTNTSWDSAGAASPRMRPATETGFNSSSRLGLRFDLDFGKDADPDYAARLQEILDLRKPRSSLSPSSPSSPSFRTIPASGTSSWAGRRNDGHFEERYKTAFKHVGDYSSPALRASLMGFRPSSPGTAVLPETARPFLKSLTPHFSPTQARDDLRSLRTLAPMTAA
mmetsp:Transcript_59661/g.139592  ORF Transcript_59661/g.139592 Transcript_59661/m.139592 type:complete len:400 (-) Transcript_59661:122-1321(-)